MKISMMKKESSMTKQWNTNNNTKTWTQISKLNIQWQAIEQKRLNVHAIQTQTQTKKKHTHSFFLSLSIFFHSSPNYVCVYKETLHFDHMKTPYEFHYFAIWFTCLLIKYQIRYFFVVVAVCLYALNDDDVVVAVDSSHYLCVCFFVCESFAVFFFVIISFEFKLVLCGRSSHSRNSNRKKKTQHQQHQQQHQQQSLRGVL